MITCSRLRSFVFLDVSIIEAFEHDRCAFKRLDGLKALDQIVGCRAAQGRLSHVKANH
jgi:hypothetical protein